MWLVPGSASVDTQGDEAESFTLSGWFCVRVPANPFRALCRSPYLVTIALFVLLLLLFMIFSNRVALARYPRRKKSIERNPRLSNALYTGMGGEG